MLDTNCNIGWHFYRNYFNDISLDKEYLKTDEVESLFKGKNDAIAGTEFKLVDFSTPLSNCAFRLKTVYPGLLLGSGYGHETGGKGEFKLGFFFDHTTGLPVLPGSSLKGALRSAFPNWERDRKTPDEIKEVKTRWIASLIRNSKMETVEFNEALKNEIHTLEQAVFDGIRDNNAMKDAGKYYSIYERNIFFDAFIVERGKEKKILGTDSITPHGDNPLRNPTPIPFLKVLPGIVFEFRFRLNNAGMLSIEQMECLFRRILLEKGVGAKTNVGYGQFVDSQKPLDKISTPLIEKKVYQFPDSAVFSNLLTKGCILRAIIVQVKNDTEFDAEVFLGNKSLGKQPLKTNKYLLKKAQTVAVEVKGITKGKITSIRLTELQDI